jgi:hypothetical protein
MQGAGDGEPVGRSTRRLRRMCLITETGGRPVTHWAGEWHAAIVGRNQVAYPMVKVEPELAGLDLAPMGISKVGETREADLAVRHGGWTWI